MNGFSTITVEEMYSVDGGLTTGEVATGAAIVGAIALGVAKLCPIPVVKHGAAVVAASCGIIVFLAVTK